MIFEGHTKDTSILQRSTSGQDVYVAHMVEKIDEDITGPCRNHTEEIMIRSSHQYRCQDKKRSLFRELFHHIDFFNGKHYSLSEYNRGEYRQKYRSIPDKRQASDGI